MLYMESAKTVNEMTLNELVKLTTLQTTGPSLSSAEFTHAKLNVVMNERNCSSRYE